MTKTKCCASTVVPPSEDYVVPLGGNLYYGRAKEATQHCQDGSSKKLDWRELAFQDCAGGVLGHDAHLPHPQQPKEALGEGEDREHLGANGHRELPTPCRAAWTAALRSLMTS